MYSYCKVIFFWDALATPVTDVRRGIIRNYFSVVSRFGSVPVACSNLAHRPHQTTAITMSKPTTISYLKARASSDNRKASCDSRSSLDIMSSVDLDLLCGLTSSDQMAAAAPIKSSNGPRPPFSRLPSNGLNTPTPISTTTSGADFLAAIHRRRGQISSKARMTMKERDMLLQEALEISFDPC